MLGCEIVEKSKIAFRARAPGRRNPHSSSSPGKPDTWQRGVGDPMAGTWRDAKCKLPRRSSPSTENVADTEKVQVHHIRKLSDLKVKGQREKPTWLKVMSAMRHKTLIVCERCHVAIHAGRPTRTHEDQEEPIKG